MQFTDQEISAINKVVTSFAPNTELAVAKFVEGECQYYGTRCGVRGAEPVENHCSVFEIGSLTKLMTSSVLAQMVSEGKLTLDEAINSQLDIPIRDNRSISYGALATHTSGLPRLPPGLLWQALFKRKHNPYEAYLRDDLLHHLAHTITLGSQNKVNYSNLGAGLLGYVLSELEGRNYAQLLQNRLFKPLNMRYSFTNWRDVAGELVIGIGKNGEPTNNWDLGVLQGAGAVLSCVKDLAQYAKVQFAQAEPWVTLQQQILVEKRLEKVALGWFVLGSKEQGDLLYFHDGGTGGYSSVMLLDMDSQSGYIILSNISGLHKLKGQKVTKLGFELMRSLKGF
ncbi:beta-lactamase family protein [Pseudoalteromonas luteoviolacea]|uniref:serine hydrolase domain-containing protein n=1 Tax=Pseudoalteromonas luteoviolacea TaxID=43657 RepID=UPI001B366D10|nr:serine hydrolase domain-containing protein [Pseudoalteromonas luteoviolacea]MBQ4811668.1 beta-lactamase family protein [Pseudoalteromonas luteoviolacea]